jgi:hypothetical protein
MLIGLLLAQALERERKRLEDEKRRLAQEQEYDD